MIKSPSDTALSPFSSSPKKPPVGTRRASFMGATLIVPRVPFFAKVPDELRHGVDIIEEFVRNRFGEMSSCQNAICGLNISYFISDNQDEMPFRFDEQTRVFEVIKSEGSGSFHPLESIVRGIAYLWMGQRQGTLFATDNNFQKKWREVEFQAKIRIDEALDLLQPYLPHGRVSVDQWRLSSLSYLYSQLNLNEPLPMQPPWEEGACAEVKGFLGNILQAIDKHESFSPYLQGLLKLKRAPLHQDFESLHDVLSLQYDEFDPDVKDLLEKRFVAELQAIGPVKKLLNPLIANHLLQDPEGILFDAGGNLAIYALYYQLRHGQRLLKHQFATPIDEMDNDHRRFLLDMIKLLSREFSPQEMVNLTGMYKEKYNEDLEVLKQLFPENPGCQVEYFFASIGGSLKC